MVKIAKHLVLASRSPRRRALLKQIGIEFEVRESGVDESLDAELSPLEHVQILSRLKAERVSALFEDAFIVGADTIVVLDGTILGKPGSSDEAKRMLRVLSNRTHTVFTGFTILDRPSDHSVTSVEATEVTFRGLSDEEIAAYVATGSPMDKAGAYGIQDDYGALFIDRIEGCFYNVVGFPLTKFYVTLQHFQQQLGLG